MKILAVSPFHEGLRTNIDMLTRLKSEMEAVETAITAFVALDEAFKGEGGHAIRSFYNEVHLPFIRLFHMTQSDFLNVLERMDAALSALEPDPSGFIRESFLEGEVEQGLDEIAMVTASLTDEANQIMSKVADIIALPNMDDSDVQDGVYRSKKKRDNTVTELHAFDSEQTSVLSAIHDHLQVMQRWITDVEGMFTDDRSDIHFDTGQWAELLAKNLLQTDVQYQEKFTTGVLGGSESPKELQQSIESNLIEANKTIAATSKDEDLQRIYAALATEGAHLQTRARTKASVNDGNPDMQYKAVIGERANFQGLVPPNAGKAAKAVLDFLVMDDVNTILDKDASLLDKGMAIVSVTPIGKGIKAGRLGFKFLKKTFGGKTKDVGKVADPKKMGIVDNDKILTKNGAFRDAKRNAGIPNSTQHKKPVDVYDGSTENRRVYEFEVDGKKKYIIEHREDKFGRGPHFHGADDLKGSPLEKGRYNQYPGHSPEDLSGYKKKGNRGEGD
ncbi:T7SS effector LXG polymorphic toxin [Sporosarcina sp. FSL W7-1349]|uniref:T7SS effector LXG polymorphic toxin n=1 Tax=Sporosarcina sp. FSL W7-1349 TaxID=2921561 RepID=UPI0030FA2BA2